MAPGIRTTPAPGRKSGPGRRLIPVGLFLLAVLVFSRHHPLTRPIRNDCATNAQYDQVIADGGIVHRDTFNIHSGLATLLGGAAIKLGRLVGLPDLLGLRAFSIALGAACVVFTYELALALTGALAAAVAAACFLAGFSGFGERLAIAPEPKTVLLLFGLAALLAMARRRWFAAGAWGALAGLCWQIGWIYWLAAIMLAGIQPGDRFRERLSRIRAAVAGGLLPLAAYALYFLWHGAAREMVHQILVAPLLIGRLEQMGRILPRLVRLGQTFRAGFPLQVPVGVLGLLGAVVLGAVILRRHRGCFRRLPGDPGAPLLMVFAGFLLYALLDFQNWPDWLPLLPLLAVFAAALAWMAIGEATRRSGLAPGWAAAILLILAAANLGSAFLPGAAAAGNRLTWRDQERIAAEWDRLLPPGEPVYVLGKAEMLFFTKRRQLGKYGFIFGGVDASIEAFEPGGFRGYLETLRAARPAAVVLHRVKRNRFADRRRYDRLLAWVRADYVPLRVCRAVGKGSFYVRRDLAEHIPAAGDCFSRAEG